MFQDLNPQDQTTAFLEIGIMLLGAAIIGFVTAWLIRRVGKSGGADPAVEERHMADLKKNHAAIQNLKAKLEKADKDYTALEKKYKDTDRALKEKSKPALAFSTEIDDVKKRLKEEKAAREALQSKFDRLKAEAKSKSEKSDDGADPRVDQLQKEVAALTAQNKELIRNAESDQAEKEDSGVIDRLQKELTALKSQNEELLKKGAAPANDETKAQVSELERQLRQQKIEVVQKTADIASLQNKLAGLEAAQKKTAKEVENEDNEKLAKLEAELESRAAVIARLEGQVGKSESIAREAANTAAEMPQLKDKIKSLEVEILSLKTNPDASTTTKALKKANAKIEELSNALAEAKNKLDSQADQPTASATGESSTELDWLRKEKEDQEAEISELEDSIQNLEKDNAQLRSRLRDKTGSQTEKHLQLVEKERDALRHELEKLRKAKVKDSASGANLPPDFSHLGEVAAGISNALSKINGIDAEVEKKLKELGIFTFGQMSQMSGSDVKKVEKALNLEAGRVKREKWVKQAKKLM